MSWPLKNRGRNGWWLAAQLVQLGPLLRVTSLSHPISQSVMHRLCPYYCRVHCFYLTPHPADSLCLSHPSLCTELTLPLVHILHGYFPKEVVAQGMAEAATLDEEQQTMEAATWPQATCIAFCVQNRFMFSCLRGQCLVYVACGYVFLGGGKSSSFSEDSLSWVTWVWVAAFIFCSPHISKEV